jgi:uncharacterized protein (DUF433 family)
MHSLWQSERDRPRDGGCEQRLGCERDRPRDGGCGPVAPGRWSPDRLGALDCGVLIIAWRRACDKARYGDLTFKMERGTLILHTEGEVEMREQWIVSDPNVMMGKPVVAGTRITVELILEKLAAGETIEQILDAHPRLSREAIQAALAFAKEALRADVVYPVAEAVG